MLLSWLISIALPAALPLVQPAQLAPGAHYTWTYFKNGAPYSTERYEFEAVKGTRYVFVMRSRIDAEGETELRPTHRVTVDYARCLEAHRDPRTKHNFLIEMQSLGSPGSPAYFQAATAFEEKFNCHGIAREGFPSPYQTVFAELATPFGQSTLFQQKRNPADQLLAFYFLDHPALAGVAYRKEFRDGSQEPYEMRLVEWHQP